VRFRAASPAQITDAEFAQRDALQGTQSACTRCGWTLSVTWPSSVAALRQQQHYVLTLPVVASNTPITTSRQGRTSTSSSGHSRCHAAAGTRFPSHPPHIQNGIRRACLPPTCRHPASRNTTNAFGSRPTTPCPSRPASARDVLPYRVVFERRRRLRGAVATVLPRAEVPSASSGNAWGVRALRRRGTAARPQCYPRRDNSESSMSTKPRCAGLWRRGA
jgi:hypothetical protein